MFGDKRAAELLYHILSSALKCECGGRHQRLALLRHKRALLMSMPWNAGVWLCQQQRACVGAEAAPGLFGPTSCLCLVCGACL
jgi:hypothetical protein